MSEPIYAVGDLQGCLESFEELLDMLDPNASFVFVGDIVNRGPASLETLRRVKALDETGRCRAVTTCICWPSPRVQVSCTAAIPSAKFLRHRTAKNCSSGCAIARCFLKHPKQFSCMPGSHPPGHSPKLALTPKKCPMHSKARIGRRICRECTATTPI